MAKPKLALIPATQGSKLYSVLPADGVGDFNFSRGTTATRINKDGLIETVASGVSRLNYPLIDGVVNGCPSHLLEPVKQNVLQRSEEFDNSYWINNGCSINANQTISPSGELNADLLTGVSGGFGVVLFSTWTATNKVASCFAKKGSTDLFRITNGSNGNFSEFNLTNGTVSQNTTGFVGEIENYGNGWYRCIAIDTLERSGTFSLNVTAASESVYIWGSQLESDYLTSYIPTTTSAVTRSAETANGAGDASTFNDSEGVLMAEISALADIGSFENISLSNGSSASRVFLFYRNSLNLMEFRVTVNNSIQMVFQHTIADAKTSNKFAIKYKENDFAIWINGIEVYTNPNGITFGSFPLTNLSLDNGQVSAPTSPFYGSTKQIQYFDSALNDSDLETLTSWVSFTDMANGQLYTIE